MDKKEFELTKLDTETAIELTKLVLTPEFMCEHGGQTVEQRSKLVYDTFGSLFDKLVEDEQDSVTSGDIEYS